MFIRVRKMTLFLLLFSSFSFAVSAQRLTPRSITITTNLFGFYEYLPPGYNNPNERFPLLIYIHGIGDIGNGKTELPYLLRDGIPKLINENKWPTSFRYGNTDYRFIVICPQFLTWADARSEAAMVDYAVRNYKVDPSRVYITGLSMGGAATWEAAGANGYEFASQVAAIVPIAARLEYRPAWARNIANAHVPVWVVHNQGDAGYFAAKNYYDSLTLRYRMSPTPLSTFPSLQGHDAWTDVYTGRTKTPNGLTIYEWLLSQQRGSVVLPVSLESFQVRLSARREVTLDWLTASELNNKEFGVEHSTDGINFMEISVVKGANDASGSRYRYIHTLAPLGSNYYRLRQTDLDGSKQYLETRRIEVESGEGLALKLFPVPAAGDVNLEIGWKEAGKVQLEIVNSTGAIIKRLDLSKPRGVYSTRLSLPGLSPGLYILKAKLNGNSASQTFTRQ